MNDERIVKYNKPSHQICWGTTKLEGRHSDGNKRERVKLLFGVLALDLIYYLVQSNQISTNDLRNYCATYI